MAVIAEGQRELREMARDMWRGTPDDAKPVLAVALAMPVLMMAYMLGWNIAAARVSFMAAITILTMCVASLIGKRSLKNIPTIFDYLAMSLFAVGLLVVFITPAMGLEPVAWRIVAVAGQAVMVVAWLTLWRLRRRWLSRTIAGRAALAACVGLCLFVLTNFLITDPLASMAQWGIELPKGVVGRTLAPIVELLPALLLYGLIIPPWLRFLRRNGAV